MVTKVKNNLKCKKFYEASDVVKFVNTNDLEIISITSDAPFSFYLFYKLKQ